MEKRRIFQTVSFEKHQKLLEVLDQKVVIEVEKIIKIDELAPKFYSLFDVSWRA